MIRAQPHVGHHTVVFFVAIRQLRSVFMRHDWLMENLRMKPIHRQPDLRGKLSMFHKKIATNGVQKNTKDDGFFPAGSCWTILGPSR